MNLLLLQSSQLLLLPSKRAMQVKGGIRVPQLLKKGILGRASMYPSKITKQEKSRFLLILSVQLNTMHTPYLSGHGSLGSKRGLGTQDRASVGIRLTRWRHCIRTLTDLT